MKVSRLVFGSLVEVIGQGDLTLEGISDTDKLAEYLWERYPALKSRQYRMALNETLITGRAVLSDGDTVALLPPFSGG